MVCEAIEWVNESQLEVISLPALLKAPVTSVKIAEAPLPISEPMSLRSLPMSLTKSRAATLGASVISG